MNFICTEFDKNINNLYLKKSIDQSSIFQNGYLYTKSSKLDTKDGIIYYYVTDILRKILYNQNVNDFTAYTPTAWLTAKSITGIDHTGLSNTYIFNANTCASLINSYIYIILADDGVHFALPTRLTTSIQIINFEVVSKYTSFESNYSFQNETNKLFTISNQSDDTVNPTVLDSTLKSQRINKYKSKQSIITIQSGVDAKPLDYVLWEGNYYLLVSKSEIKTNLYLYTCVSEQNTTNSISGADINPIIGGILIVNETQSSGTQGGTFTSGAWRTRVLNTVIVNTINGSSLASNQITLPPGIYTIFAKCPAYAVENNQIILYNITNSVTTSMGTSEYAGASSAYPQISSEMIGYFSISTKTVFEIRHICWRTQATNGLGLATTLNTEVYSIVRIEKIG